MAPAFATTAAGKRERARRDLSPRHVRELSQRACSDLSRREKAGRRTILRRCRRRVRARASVALRRSQRLRKRIRRISGRVPACRGPALSSRRGAARMGHRRSRPRCRRCGRAERGARGICGDRTGGPAENPHRAGKGVPDRRIPIPDPSHLAHQSGRRAAGCAGVARRGRRRDAGASGGRARHFVDGARAGRACVARCARGGRDARRRHRRGAEPRTRPSTSRPRCASASPTARSPPSSLDAATRPISRDPGATATRGHPARPRKVRHLWRDHDHRSNSGECRKMEAAVATSSSPFVRRAAAAYAAAAKGVDTLQPLFALALRLYVARVFFTSGVIKLGNWAGTLGLFRNEYHVPLLPPALAAVMGTTAELALPVFLAARTGHARRGHRALRLQHRRGDVVSRPLRRGSQGSHPLGLTAAGDDLLRPGPDLGRPLARAPVRPLAIAAARPLPSRQLSSPPICGKVWHCSLLPDSRPSTSSSLPRSAGSTSCSGTPR